MDTQAIKAELLNCERQYWQSLKDKDPETARRLTDFPCIVTGAQGVAAMDEKTFSSMMSGAQWTLKDFKLDDDVQVRMLSDDIAIVAYKVHEDMTVEGQPVSLDAADASVWIKRDGQWQCALHTESLSGDPFGRDRQAQH
jgi:hypothetical protein